jgi:hypothetical protein
LREDYDAADYASRSFGSIITLAAALSSERKVNTGVLVHALSSREEEVDILLDAASDVVCLPDEFPGRRGSLARFLLSQKCVP